MLLDFFLWKEDKSSMYDQCNGSIAKSLSAEQQSRRQRCSPSSSSVRTRTILLILCALRTVCSQGDTQLQQQNNRRRRTKFSSSLAEVERCNSSYAFLQRKFLPDRAALSREPILLLSHQGSGNTWTRLLLEYSTGIYTGSVYSDTKLYDILPAEAECGRIMSVNRAHPDVCKISPGPGGHVYPRDKKWITIHFSGYRRKCHRGQIYGFKRFLIVLRDPYRAMWAEYQRVNTKGVHNTGIEKENFNQQWWEEKLVHEIAPNFAIHWNRIYQRIFQMWPKDHFLVQYEHLLDRGKRYSVMSNMINFLNLTETVTKDRLDCSFVFADRPTAHRTIDKSKMVSIEQVYQNATVVCMVWDFIRNLTDFPSYGYRPWKGIVCPPRVSPDPIIPCHMVPRLMGFDVTSSKVLTERDFNCTKQ